MTDLEAMQYISLRYELAVSYYFNGWDEQRAELIAAVLKMQKEKWEWK